MPAEDSSRERPYRVLQTTAAAFLCLAVLAGIALARHWPLVHDAPLIHYAVFLMDHGFAPYRDIVEMNMPGSYMLDWAVVHALGPGSTAWWAFDSLTGLAALVAGAALAGPGLRWAGISGAGVAYLWHLSDGAANLGQRDWSVTVLLLAAFACLSKYLRHLSPAWLAGFTALAIFAATIKPPVLIALLLLPALLPRQGKQPAVLYSFAGALLPLLAIAIFLTRWHVWHDFNAALHGLVPFYASLQTLPFPQLLRQSLPPALLLLAAITLVLFFANRSWNSRPSLLLLGGTLLGFALFLLQRKGWSYHRYTTLAFLLLLFFTEIARALRAALPIRRYTAAALLVATVLWMPVHTLRREALTGSPHDAADTVSHLQLDLTYLGGPTLSSHVQCLDMALGNCINALYSLQLVQSTGFIYDFYLFPEQDTPLTRTLQSRFLTEITTHPPRVLILSSQIWPSSTDAAFGYTQFDRWPAFRDLLAAHYTLASTYQRNPDSPSIGYRLFVLK